MATDKKIEDKNLLYNINREAAKNNQPYHLIALINTNILQVMKDNLLIKSK